MGNARFVLEQEELSSAVFFLSQSDLTATSCNDIPDNIAFMLCFSDWSKICRHFENSVAMSVSELCCSSVLEETICSTNIITVFLQGAIFVHDESFYCAIVWNLVTLSHIVETISWFSRDQLHSNFAPHSEWDSTFQQPQAIYSSSGVFYPVLDQLVHLYDEESSVNWKKENW